MDRKTVRNIGKVAGCLALLACTVMLAPVLLLGGLLIAGSERTIYERIVSPDGRHDARVQFDNGGAVSSFSRLVFVKHRWNRSDEPLLSCRAFWGDGEAAVHLRWLDSSTLLIRHSFPADAVEASADHCGPIRIVVQGPRVTPSRPAHVR
jgi:hypothetical protein